MTTSSHAHSCAFFCTGHLHPPAGFDPIQQEISPRGVRNKTELRGRNWLKIYCHKYHYSNKYCMAVMRAICAVGESNRDGALRGSYNFFPPRIQKPEGRHTRPAIDENWGPPSMKAGRQVINQFLVRVFCAPYFPRSFTHLFEVFLPHVFVQRAPPHTFGRPVRPGCPSESTYRVGSGGSHGASLFANESSARLIRF